MGLKGVKGLRIEKPDPNAVRGGGGGRQPQLRESLNHNREEPSGGSSKNVSAAKRKVRTDRQAQGELGVPKRLRHQGAPSW